MRRMFGTFVPEYRKIDGVRYRVTYRPEIPVGVRAIQVDEFDSGHAEDSLDFLEPAQGTLTHLIVTNGQIRDVSVLERLPALRNVTLNTGKIRKGVEAPIPGLEEVGLGWSERVRALLAGPRLTKVVLDSPPKEVPVAGMSLEKLRLTGVGHTCLPSVRVRDLWIASGIRRGTIEGLRQVAGLRELWLDNVVPTDLGTSPDPAFSQLRSLALEDCRNIPSLLPFAETQLDELIVIGDVSVQDGTLAGLNARKRRFPPGWA
ncbi:hypothetical protein GCM10029976_032110 [Kribbella albertanoniae]|uniref:Leucine-rich repeat domain-containing protein n=1 Tax=Kribbella albertanoniae TaxID=1266829 RepID=A0A4R4QH72_9ACTN|nr:hypothetical protein [Kribbella albertanoniae]TDC34978.1 hypothetical protein E1261_02010 [Kribbella albertanoniae]